MIETLPIVRVCAACEAELLAGPKGQTAAGPEAGAPVASHGLCRRHFIGALRHAGCSEAEIAAALSDFSDQTFCEDQSSNRKS